jgi:membrane protease YdiL (CAAX protease family)
MLSEGTSTKGVICFLALAFGLTWARDVVPWQAGVPLVSPRGQLLILVGGFGAAVAAIIVRKWVTREGFADAALGIRPRAWPYFLLAWTYPLFLVAGVVLLAFVLGFGTPNNSLREGLRPLLPEGATAPDWPVVVVVPNLMFTSILVTPLLWGEEFGSRGYLQPRLFPGRPLAAAMATGVIWGIWHYPILLMAYNFPEQRLAGLIVFPISMVLLSVIFGWLLDRSGSTWAPSLAHAALNSIGGSLTLLFYPDPSLRIFTHDLGVLGWAPLGIICFILWATSYRPGRRRLPKAEQAL